MRTLIAMILASCQDVHQTSETERHLMLGKQEYELAHYKEAEQEYREAVRLMDREPGTLLVAALNNLGTLLAVRGETERALPVLRRALAVSRGVMNLESRTLIAANTAQVYLRLGDFGGAQQVLAELRPEAEGERTPGLVYLLSAEAGVAVGRRDTHQAHSLLDRVMGLIGPEHPLAAGAHHLRGLAWQRSGNHRLAVSEFALALEMARRTAAWDRGVEAIQMLADYYISLKKLHLRAEAAIIGRELASRKRLMPLH